MVSRPPTASPHARESVVMQSTDSESRRVSFGTFELDLDRGELTRSGMFVRLEPLPTRVLILLIENAGHMVLREEIVRRAWPVGQAVSERSLNTVIRHIRRVLGDSAAAPCFIETIPRRGYRFIHSVAEAARPAVSTQISDAVQRGKSGGLPADSSRSPRRSRRFVPWLTAGVSFAAILLAFATWTRVGRPDDRSTRVAVLPLHIFSATPDDTLFSAVFEDELISTLARPGTGDLAVIARTSSARYRNPAGSISEIARELGARFLIEGSYLRDGDIHRITVRLVSADDGTQLWTQSHDIVSMTEIGSTASVIASKVARSLGATHSGRARAALEPIEEARLSFLVGQHLLRQETWSGRARSIPYLREVTRRDPDFAPAHAMLAEALVMTDQAAMAIDAITRALRLDADLPRAHLVAGLATMILKGDQEAAEQSFRRAARLAGSDPRPLQAYAYHFLIRGETDDALRWMKRAVSLDPVSAMTTGDLGYFYYWAGRFYDAIEWCGRARELDPDVVWPLSCMYDAAIAADDGATARGAAVALLHAWEPKIDGTWPIDAVARVRDLRAERVRAGIADQDDYYSLALAYADLGRITEGATALARAADDPSLIMMTAAVEPRLGPLRGTAAYRTLIGRLGLDS